ncbi:hypothetical protein RHSIM_Rhsim02G0248200 [Rhododendron simsii]|uniref:Auxin response factor n=1 Tax=Rhododendron simsii TaxID=118357 RepID=A0A834LU78_RHOSS|nr:hypothetical protein RHSIM_Rhsim02G0248200 [Rhododendron simsii]
MNEEARGKAILKATPSELALAEEIIADNVELLTKILARLPRKSVAQFKSVSKHWLSLLSSIAGSGGDNLYKELWKACAGPLMDVPRVGERVFYFPQGELEQVKSVEIQINGGIKSEISTLQTSLTDPLQSYGHSASVWRNICSPKVELFVWMVVQNCIASRSVLVSLRILTIDSDLCPVHVVSQYGAEHDTDEVYAHFTLIPEQDQSEPTSPDLYPPEPLTPKIKSFCKVLTASDTIGGFTVLRKHADECLPALDMNQRSPMQELIAKDLHGAEWRFKHIFRGQPKRHLLATGWSKFVTKRKLVAGDSVVFLSQRHVNTHEFVSSKGENGELRVGVRRAARQQFTMPSSVISSQRMHLGVQAAAYNAPANWTVFFAYDKPSSSQFVVGLNKYLEAVNNYFRVGMRFKMRFEGEDSSLIRCTGTIVGVEDLSPQWENSKWRSLKVQWDEPEPAPIPRRPERVSPWEIEPIVLLFGVDLRNPPNA